jgi:hypothetical protein
VLFVVALRHFGATGAAVISRAGARGEVVRLGDSSRADLRLAGAGGSAAELLSDGAGWRVRRPDGSVGRVRDGDAVACGPWLVVLALADAPDPAEPCPADDPAGDDDAALPRFTVAGAEPAYVRDTAPALLGAAPWCGLRLAPLGLPVAAVVRRDRFGATSAYPVPGVDLRRGGRRMTAPARLRDGDMLEAGGAPAVRFSDPQEELDRLHGAVSAEAPPAAPPPRLGRGDDAWVTVSEAALWAAAAAVALGYAALVWSRW